MLRYHMLRYDSLIFGIRNERYFDCCENVISKIRTNRLFKKFEKLYLTSSGQRLYVIIDNRIRNK